MNFINAEPILWYQYKFGIYKTINLSYVPKQMFHIIKMNIQEGLLSTFGVAK